MAIKKLSIYIFCILTIAACFGGTVYVPGDGTGEGSSGSGASSGSSGASSGASSGNSSGASSSGSSGASSGGSSGSSSGGGVNCGNGSLDPTEVCDDGNTDSNDGCSNDCLSIEEGFECSETGCVRLCGNSEIDDGELCDDGNSTAGDGCSATCTVVEAGFSCPDSPGACVEICGNGTLEPDETCDDGNRDAGDGCGVDCVNVELGFVCPSVGDACIELEVCGNGLLESSAAEVCDDGNDASGDGCAADCRSIESDYDCPVPGELCTRDCGDGTIDAPHEVCDDGNLLSSDGCRGDCREIEVGYECPTPNSACRLSCGDGDIDAGEACDVLGGADNDDGDGCNADCTIESGWECPMQTFCNPLCGNGILDDSEICDEGDPSISNPPATVAALDCSFPNSLTVCNGVSTTYGCQKSCTYQDPSSPGDMVNFCGDEVQDFGEECDEGDANDDDDYDGCTSACLLGARCGDSVQNGPEQCDAGSGAQDYGDGSCTSECLDAPFCGDGSIDDTTTNIESCDDGNNTGGDGCTATNCQLEPGFICHEPGIDCAPVLSCGNGVLDEAYEEPCDDGNADDGDGCSSMCALEPGFSCEAGVTVPTACFKNCAIDANCDADDYCDGSVCRPDVCAPPGELYCSAETVTACSERGDLETLGVTCASSSYFVSTCAEVPALGNAFCECQDDWDCPAFMFCEGGACVGTGEAPTCFLPPEPFDNVLPVPEIQWGGSNRFDRDAHGSQCPSSAQVVQTPLVINLDDDNGDGLINEFDFPEIIFITFAGSSFRDDGLLRAIHGGGANKGEDYFTTTLDAHWDEILVQEAIDGGGVASDVDIAVSDCDNSSAHLNSTSTLAAGDLNNDGVPEIVAVDENRRLTIYDNRGRIMSTNSGTGQVPSGNQGPTLANLDGLGLAEIVVGNDVVTLEEFSHADPEIGTALRFLAIYRGARNEGRNGQGPVSCVADLDADGLPEIIGGASAYKISTDGSGVIDGIVDYWHNRDGVMNPISQTRPSSCATDYPDDEDTDDNSAPGDQRDLCEYDLFCASGATPNAFGHCPVDQVCDRNCAVLPSSCEALVGDQSDITGASANVCERDVQAFCSAPLVDGICPTANLCDRDCYLVPSDGFCAVADLLGADQEAAPGPGNELDDVPEVLNISNRIIYVLNGQNGSILRRFDHGLGRQGGPPNVDDFDGDGYPEFASAFATAYRVFDLQEPSAACPAWPSNAVNEDHLYGRDISNDEGPTGANSATPRSPPNGVCTDDIDCSSQAAGTTCNERTGACICLHNEWGRATEDDSSRVTGSSVFDFNGDGAAEVVYNDECRFRIYDGLNGALYMTEPSESRTRIEYPIVADVDNDGNAEIVFGTTNESQFCSRRQNDFVCATDAECDAAFSGSKCVDTDGAMRCVAGCVDNGDCTEPGFSCNTTAGVCEGCAGSGDCRWFVGDGSSSYSECNTSTQRCTLRYQALYNNGIEVWGDSGDFWVSARRIWNQHAYHVTHVTEAGQIPARAPDSWLEYPSVATDPNAGERREYNLYRSNPRSRGLAPDLVISNISISSPGEACGTLSNEIEIAFTILNQGDLRVGPGVPVAFSGQLSGGYQDLGLSYTLGTSLEPGASLTDKVSYIAASVAELPAEVTVEADPITDALNNPSGLERECLDFNNALAAEVVSGTTQPDLTVSIDALSGTLCAPELEWTVTNEGSDAVSDFELAFFAGDPSAGGELLASTSLSSAVAAGGGTVSGTEVFNDFPVNRTITIYVVVDPNLNIVECDEADNVAIADETRFCSSSL